MCTQCLCTSTPQERMRMYSRKPVKTGNWKSSKIWRAALQCNVTRSAVGRDVVSTSHYIFNIFSIYIYTYIIYFLWFLYILYPIYIHWPTPRSPSGQQTKRPLPGHISRIFDRCGAGLGPVESGIGSGQGGTILWHDVTSCCSISVGTANVKLMCISICTRPDQRNQHVFLKSFEIPKRNWNCVVTQSEWLNWFTDFTTPFPFQFEIQSMVIFQRFISVQIATSKSHVLNAKKCKACLEGLSVSHMHRNPMCKCKWPRWSQTN